MTTDTQLFWLTGQRGAGKTEVGKELKDYIDHWFDKKSILLDDDEMRKLYDNQDHSKAGHHAAVEFAQRLCELMIYNGLIPIVCMVSPFADQRRQMKDLYKCKEVYVFCTEPRPGDDFHVDYFEKPIGEHVAIDTTGKTVKESFRELVSGTEVKQNYDK